ncbi:MAG: protein kinase [Myxococcales bacterium]|nr:protein kinase [Myxococcales bacterium]
MRCGLWLAFLALSACTSQADLIELGPVEYQWAEEPVEAAWQVAPGLELGPRGGEVLWFRVQVPALPGPDPAVQLSALFADAAWVCGQKTELRGHTQILPLPCTPTQVLIRNTADARTAVRRPVAGSEQRLWTRVLETELAPFTVGVMMTLAGLLLGLAGLRPGAERAYRGLGLFLVGIGVIASLNARQLRHVFPVSGSVLFVAHELATTLYPIGFADFVLGTFGDGRWRVLRRGLRLFVLYAAVAWVLHLTGLLHLNTGRAPTALFIVAFLLQAVVLAAQARKTDPSAWLFLFGIGALLVVSLPDILDGAGFKVLPFQTVPYAALTFGAAMVAVVERQHRQARETAQASARELAAKLAVLEERNREIDALNQELRHQIAERSRQMADALQQGSATVSERQALEAGELIDGRYRVLRLLGQGAMGAVHAVERLSDARTFALKIMSGRIDSDAGARFAREAEIAASVASEHLVTVVDVGGQGSGRLYLVMEYVEGRPLEDLRSRFGDVPWALELLWQITDGVRALHAAGVVHRDLKPGNVLVGAGAEGRELAKISDFGISRLGAPSEGTGREVPGAAGMARPVDSPALPDVQGHAATHMTDPRAGAPGLTATGVLMGTPAYMAPELANGARSASPASDLFALGLMAYELFTGRPAHAETPIFAALSGRKLSAVAPLPPEVPQAVAGLVLRSLSERPDARPTAEQLLEALLAGRPSRAGA